MAQCDVVTTTEVIQVVTKKIVLELSEREAFALYLLTQSAAGCPRDSLRKDTDNVGTALRQNIPRDVANYGKYIKSGYIAFRADSEVEDFAY